MAITDGEVAILGVTNLLLANSAFMTALGPNYKGSAKVWRDTIPQGCPNPAVALTKSGFKVGARPQKQGGVSTQLWSRGIVSAYIATGAAYSGSLARALIDALDGHSYYVVTGVGELKWIRLQDEPNDESVTIGDKVYKLAKVNFDIAAKAT